MRVVFAIILFVNLLFCFTIDRPYKSIKVDNKVLKIFVIDDKIYISTIDGVIDIYDIKKDKFIDKIKLKRIKNFFEDDTHANVLSLDVLNQNIIILADDDYGKKILYSYSNGELKSIKVKNEAIKSALFLDSSTLILSSISNEIYFYSIKLDEIFKSFKISTAMLSAIHMTDDKNQILLAPESGKVYFYDFKKDDFTSIIDIHTDNIYSIAYKNNVLITGGADSVLGIYRDNTLLKKRPGSLIYAVALNTKADIGAYVSEKLTDIYLIDTKNGDKIGEIKTGQRAINSIAFINNNDIVSASFDNEILFWRIK
ncbi:WD40 repeat domain-containing protein [Campylobacter majalis]|uniref:WD40 repeat domain-containing protein n=1 Tax=Campylobacter majalis TaxID=2790656 RepID=UPI003D68133B